MLARWTVAALACSPTTAPLPTAGGFEGAGGSVASGDAAVHDSGGSELGDAPTTPDPVVCADPSQRADQGPFEALDLPPLPMQEFEHEPDMTNASGLAVGDLDGDGRLDLLLPQAGPSRLLMQQEDGSFVDESDARWPDRTSGAPGAAALHPVDIDGDGDLDVFLCGGPVMGSEPGPVHNQLFLNDGTGHLTNVSAAWGLEDAEMRACFGAAFGDIDGDGDLDMATAANQACPYVVELGAQDCDLLLEQDSAQVLWENTGSRLVDVSSRLPHLPVLSSFTHVSTLIDVDADGDLDLYLTNDDKHDVSFSETNLLFRNDGTGTFSLDDGPHGLDVSIAGMGIGVADLNDDLQPDFVVSGTTRAALLLSDGRGGWYDAATASGLVFTDPGHIEAWATDFVDIDNDADLDVPFVFGWLVGDPSDTVNYAQPDAFFEQEPPGEWREVAVDWGIDDRGIGRGMVVVDLDGDGWLDLLKRELGGGVRAYRARCGAASWTHLTLSQDTANQHALGAVVDVTTGARVQRRWHLGAGTSFASSAAAGVHVGLGDATRIDRVVVTWPDGAQTTWRDLPVDTPLVLERPASSAEETP